MITAAYVQIGTNGKAALPRRDFGGLWIDCCGIQDAGIPANSCFRSGGDKSVSHQQVFHAKAESFAGVFMI